MMDKDKNSLTSLFSRLDGVMLRDKLRFSRRLHGMKKVDKPQSREALGELIAAEIEQAEQHVLRRLNSRPPISYPENLPVSQKKDDILSAIRDHQVVIVAGETGSGKTTQLPKICMELGRGIKGLIGHTQPRRLAARTVANRIAEELDSEPGQCVGYKVRFTDSVSENTLGVNGASEGRNAPTNSPSSTGIGWLAKSRTVISSAGCLACHCSTK